MTPTVPVRSLKVVRVLVACTGVLVLVAAAIPWLAGAHMARQLGSADAEVRRKALDAAVRERPLRLAPTVRRVLSAEQDRALLSSAGYALMRVGSPSDSGLLLARADQGPDDETRARLVLYAARVSRRDLRLSVPLREGLASGEPWQQAGCAIGLLELGHPAGGDALIGLAGAQEPEIRGFALAEFRRIAEPMAEAVGQVLQWPEAEMAPDPGHLEGLRRFWAGYGTPRLLSDTLSRLERVDAEWHAVNRLLHARVRVARWLQ